MANAEIAYGELLKCGVTSLVDFSGPMPDRWVSLMAESGLRVLAAPSFRDALWRVEDDSRLEYDWDEKAGRAAFDRSVALVDEICTHECGRLSGVIAPAQADTCSADTLRRSHKLANEKGLMWQTHAAQTLPEFHEMARRHGKTPVQWLDEIGVLGPVRPSRTASFSTATPGPTGTRTKTAPSWPGPARRWPIARWCSRATAMSCKASAATCATASIWGSAPTPRPIT